MSEAAVVNRQLALGGLVGLLLVLIHAIGSGFLATCRKEKSGTNSLSPIAYSRLPIASPDVAISFTVTGQVTSVTHPGLAESVLIDVSELDLGQRQGGLASRGCGRGGEPVYRSFRGGACIQ